MDAAVTIAFSTLVIVGLLVAVVFWRGRLNGGVDWFRLTALLTIGFVLIGIASAFLGVADFWQRFHFQPHGHCYEWRPWILWPMVVSDLIIWAAYMAIPVWLFRMMGAWQALRITGPAWLFIAFIVSCGFGHLLDVWVVWTPNYVMVALVRVATAGISLATAVVLFVVAKPAKAILIATGQALHEHLQQGSNGYTNEMLASLERTATMLRKLGEP